MNVWWARDGSDLCECIYITSARGRGPPGCKGAGERRLQVSPGGKRKAFPERCLYTMKDYPLETVALSSPRLSREQELPSAHARLPSSPLSVLAGACAPSTHFRAHRSYSSPSLDLASSLPKDKCRQLLQPFLNSGLLRVSSIHLMGSVSLGYLHKSGANELKETDLISELPPHLRSPAQVSLSLCPRML